MPIQYASIQPVGGLQEGRSIRNNPYTSKALSERNQKTVKLRNRKEGFAWRVISKSLLPMTLSDDLEISSWLIAKIR